MKIKNPVLRFVAGLAVTALAAAALVGLLYGLGLMMESHYAQTYPWLYAEEGYGFWTAAEQGLVGLAKLVLSGGVVSMVVGLSLAIGNWLFGSKD